MYTCKQYAVYMFTYAHIIAYTYTHIFSYTQKLKRLFYIRDQ